MYPLNSERVTYAVSVHLLQFIQSVVRTRLNEIKFLRSHKITNTESVRVKVEGEGASGISRQAPGQLLLVKVQHPTL